MADCGSFHGVFLPPRRDRRHHPDQRPAGRPSLQHRKRRHQSFVDRQQKRKERVRVTLTGDGCSSVAPSSKLNGTTLRAAEYEPR